MLDVMKDVVGLAFLAAIIIVPLVDGHKHRSGFSNWIFIR